MILMILYIAEKGQAFLHFHKNNFGLFCGPVEMFEDFITSKGEINALIEILQHRSSLYINLATF